MRANAWDQYHLASSSKDPSKLKDDEEVSQTGQK